MTVAKDQFEVVRSATIGAPPARVHALVADFRRWIDWSPWEGMDPDQERTYSGAESGTGARYSWSGNRKVGQGSMEITADTPPSRVEIALEFLKPFRSSNTTTFDIAGDGESSEVTWRMVGPRTLMTRIMGIFKSMDKMIGPDFEKGLAALTSAAESNPD